MLKTEFKITANAVFQIYRRLSKQSLAVSLIYIVINQILTPAQVQMVLFSVINFFLIS